MVTQAKIFVVLAALLYGSVCAAALPIALQERVASYHLQTKQYLPAMLAYMSLVEEYKSPLKSRLALLQVGEIAAAWGMHKTALEIFRSLEQDAGAPVATQAQQARHHLRYHQKAWQNLFDSLNKTKAVRALSEDEIFFHLESHLRLGDLATAIELSKKLDRHSKWQKFAQFNIAVKQMKQDEPAAIARMLSIVKRGTENEAWQDVADQSSLLLGYHYLSRQQHKQAMKYLERVSVGSPYSQKALLAIGWSYAEARRPDRALGAWLALADMPTDETVVQEAMLASAFTYAQMDARQEAFDAYRSAIDSYRELDDGLVKATDKVSERTYYHSVLEPGALSDEALSHKIASDRADPIYRFVHQWMSQPAYREVLNDFRDVENLRLIMQRRLQDLEAYRSLVRLQSQGGGSPQRADSGVLLKLQKELRTLEKRVEKADNGRNPFPFHSAAELRLLQDIRTLFVASQQKMQGKDRRNYVARLRRVRGVILWQLQQQSATRMITARADLAELRTRIAALDVGKGAGGIVDSPVSRDIASLAKKYSRGLTLMRPVYESLENSLYTVSARQLGLTRGRISFYDSQARFALAQLFDEQGVANAE